MQAPKLGLYDWLGKGDGTANVKFSVQSKNDVRSLS